MEIVAEKRTQTGKGVKKLRRKGLLPAVLYGNRVSSFPLVLNLKSLQNTLKHTGDTSLVDLVIDDKQREKVLISDIQRHPVSGDIIHISFHKVDLKEKITTSVPIEISGESPAVKSKVGIVLTLLDEIEIECLPTDIPNSIVADISPLQEVGDTLFVKNLAVDRTKIEVKEDPDEAVVKIDYAEQLEVEEEEQKESAEVEEETEEDADKELGEEGEKEKKE